MYLIYMNKLNCLNNKDKETEFEILTFLENKFDNIDNRLEKQIYGILKNKHIKEINNLNFAIKNINNTYLIEMKKLDELLKIKNNIGIYLKINEKKYLEELKKQVNPDFLCNICYENRCNLVLNPCGHMFCDKCYTCKEKSCYICRRKPSSCIKIFHN
jgi:hypothetical protein